MNENLSLNHCSFLFFETCSLFSIHPQGYWIMTRNSRSRKFSWESASFFLAQPWEIIFYFSFSSRNTRFVEKYSRSHLDHEIERKILLSQKMRFWIRYLYTILRKLETLTAFFENKCPETSKKCFLSCLDMRGACSWKYCQQLDVYSQTGGYSVL